MKKIYAIIAALFITISMFSQAPQKMSYQAIIRNSSDALITSTPVGMRISVLQGTSTGTAVYVETQTPSTNANGLVSLAIGTGTPVTGTFAGIDWAAGPYFIKTETDPAGGTAYTISGTNELMSVPYALYTSRSESTGHADTANICLNQYWSKTSSNLHFNSGNVAIGTVISNPMNLLCLNPVAGTRDGIEFRDQNSSNFGMKLLYNEPNNQLQIVSNNSGTETDVISFNRGDGNVGIGTSSPSAPLTIESTVGSQIILNRSENIANYGVGLDFNLKNSASNYFRYGAIFGGIKTNTSGAELGFLSLLVANGDGITDVFTNEEVIRATTEKVTIKNVLNIAPRSTAPASPAKGDMYFDNTLNKLRVYDGTTWQNCW